MFPFDEIGEALDEVVETVQDVAGDIGGAVDTVVRTGTQIVSNLDLSDVAGMAGTFLGGPFGAAAGQALGTIVEGGDWGDALSGAISGIATGGLGSLGGLGDALGGLGGLGGIGDALGGLGGIGGIGGLGDVLENFGGLESLTGLLDGSGGSLLAGAEAFLGGGLGDLGAVASTFLGAGNLDDFAGLASQFAGTFAGSAGRLAELVTGEAASAAGDAPWPLSALLDQAGLGGQAGGGAGGIFGEFLEQAGLGGLGGLAAASAGATGGQAGSDAGDDAGLFQQILERAGIDMPSAETAGPEANDDGDVGMFRDILEAAGIDTGDADGGGTTRPGAGVSPDGPASGGPAPSAPPTLQDVVGSLAATGGLGDVLGQMPQNQLADLVLNLARPADRVADRVAEEVAEATADTERRPDRADATDDLLGVGGYDDNAIDAGAATTSTAVEASASAADSGGYEDDFDLMLPGDTGDTGDATAGDLDSPATYEEPATRDFATAVDSADDVEDSFDDLFGPGQS